eukprot:5078915-Prymnesium_polylepis.2
MGRTHSGKHVDRASRAREARFVAAVRCALSAKRPLGSDQIRSPETTRTKHAFADASSSITLAGGVSGSGAVEVGAAGGWLGAPDGSTCDSRSPSSCARCIAKLIRPQWSRALATCDRACVRARAATLTRRGACGQDEDEAGGGGAAGVAGLGTRYQRAP